MLKLVHSAVTTVWVLLMMATALSWFLAADHGIGVASHMWCKSGLT
jgi:uncharacterized membrane protein